MQCEHPCHKLSFTLSVIESQIPAGVSGIYAFWYRGYCVYVGKTEKQSLRARLVKHWENSHNSGLNSWIRAKRAELKVSCLPVADKGTIASFERYYIKRLQPLTNRVLFVSVRP